MLNCSSATFPSVNYTEAPLPSVARRNLGCRCLLFNGDLRRPRTVQTTTARISGKHHIRQKARAPTSAPKPADPQRRSRTMMRHTAGTAPHALTISAPRLTLRAQFDWKHDRRSVGLTTHTLGLSSLAIAEL